MNASSVSSVKLVIIWGNLEERVLKTWTVILLSCENFIFFSFNPTVFQSEDSMSHKIQYKITHVKKVGHTSEFLKNNYLLKNLLKWANKKCKNLNIYNVLFF